MAESPDRRRDYVKFNGINFPQWKFAVMLKLKKKKLGGIVLGTETRPAEVKLFIPILRPFAILDIVRWRFS